MQKSLNDLPEILDARTVRELLGISQAGVYNLMHRSDFPTLHVGSRLMVTKGHLLEWMAKHTQSCSVQ